eukprot:7343996-Prymnesium_polylepis.1
MRPNAAGCPSNINMTGCLVSNCSGNQYTGAVMAFRDLGTGDPSYLHFDAGVIAHCRAKNGGVCFFLGIGSFNNSLVTDCTADTVGGFLVSTGGLVVMGNVTGRRVSTT